MRGTQNSKVTEEISWYLSGGLALLQRGRRKVHEGGRQKAAGRSELSGNEMTVITLTHDRTVTWLTWRPRPCKDKRAESDSLLLD